jgi:hypothetical protein
MHPPFGFALFYLKSVAPKEIRTGEIYWGAVPFVGIQLLMVALMIAFPQIGSVSHHSQGAASTLRIEVPVSDDFESAPGTFELRPEDLTDYGPGKTDKKDDHGAQDTR